MANFYLGTVRNLPKSEDQLRYLESTLGERSLGVEDVQEIAKTVGLPDAWVDRLGDQGALLGATALFRTPQGGAPTGTSRAFALRVREMVDKPAPSSADEAVQRATQPHAALLGSFNVKEKDEWDEVTNLLRRQTRDPRALRAGVETVLGYVTHNESLRPRGGPPMPGYMDRYPLLQHIRRDLLRSTLHPEEYDALYRYSRDHQVNTTLREHGGKDGIPGHVMGEHRRALPPEPWNTRGGSPLFRPHQANNTITTGHYLYMLDRGLESLRKVQGQENGPFFRATLFRQSWVDAMAQSQSFHDHGYVSTSRFPDKVTEFFCHKESIRYPDERPVLMVFETNRAVDVSSISRFQNESEHLIPRDQRFHARLVGYRRDLCPGHHIPEHENWAVFVMTDDGHAPTAQTMDGLRKLAQS
jgi:hypothetical protein